MTLLIIMMGAMLHYTIHYPTTICQLTKQASREAHITPHGTLQVKSRNSKAQFPLPELTAWVDGWPVSITCQHGPCWWAPSFH